MNNCEKCENVFVSERMYVYVCTRTVYTVVIEIELFYFYFHKLELGFFFSSLTVVTNMCQSLCVNV